MEIRQIYYVLEVAKQKNFTKAAQALYITQSNISQQIGALESELNATLFVRDHHNIYLTADGERFCKYAKRVVDAIDVLMKEFNENEEAEKAVINVAVFPFSWTVGVSEIVRNFYKANTNVVGTIRISDNYCAYEDLKKGTLDFALVKLRPEDKIDDLNYIPLIKEELMVIISRDNPIASHRTISASDLNCLPLLSGEKTTNLYEDFHKIYVERNADFHVVLENTFDRDLLLNMIASDEGITFATESTAAKIISDKITAIPLEMPIEYNTYLVYPKDKEPTGIYRAFVDSIINGIHSLNETKELKFKYNDILY
ncbi:LysR family transcriptional regulator [Ihubacter sp. rT4E-8]|uniref:LysR family transcriptional regulator n=1 Tax=unclassified Ihubacter TaxID=2633299 RepID=UPI003C7E658A